MRYTLLPLATLALSVPLILAGCATEDDMGGDGVLDGEASSTDEPTGDGDQNGDGDPASESEGDTDDTDGEEQGCNVESPYMGGYDIGCCQDEIAPTAWSPGGIGAGTVMPDYTFTDQFGDAVRLYDFCHDAVYFEYSAVW